MKPSLSPHPYFYLKIRFFAACNWFFPMGGYCCPLPPVGVIHTGKNLGASWSHFLAVTLMMVWVLVYGSYIQVPVQAMWRSWWRGTSQAYIRHILGVSWAYLRYISGISQTCLMHISGMCQPYLSHISGISQAYLRHILGISGPILAIFGIYIYWTQIYIDLDNVI